MTPRSLRPGDRAVTTFADPDLPEGSTGIVNAVHDDPADGIDLTFPAGAFNVIASGLEPESPMTTPSPRGTYLTVAQALREQIHQGDHTTGRLPSEAALTHAFGVSRNTVRRALLQLEAERLICPRPGAGWHLTGTDVDLRPLADRLTALITDENYHVGDPFPSEKSLCARFHVSRSTVRHALALMEGRGLLTVSQGRPRTVRALPS